MSDIFNSLTLEFWVLHSTEQNFLLVVTGSLIQHAIQYKITEGKLKLATVTMFSQKICLRKQKK